MAKAFAHADWPSDRRLMGYFLWLDAQRVAKLFNPDHQVALAGEDMLGPMEKYLSSLLTGLSPLQRMLALEQRFFLGDHNLLYMDKMSMAAGVEVRVPFLDRDLVRLANALPDRMKLRGTTTKWVLKQAMAPYLPHQILHRSKTGFGAPLRHWLQRELIGMVDNVLSSDRIRRRGLFDAEAVRRLVVDDRAGKIDASYTILGLICIEMWCSRFLDHAG